jgi:hypothetical protein
LARLRPEIQKLCVVRVFVDIEELVGAATEVERVIGELGETPYEPLREEQEEEASESNMENPVAVLNNALINFLKGSVPNHISSFSHTLFYECQICKGEDHIATTCPRLNEPRPKCAKCGMPHRTENYGVKCLFYLGFGHAEDRGWRKHNEGESRFGVANFLQVWLNDEEAETTDGIDVMIEDELKMVGMTIGKELRPELGATNKELTDSAEDKISTSLVEMMAMIENDTNIVSKEPPVDRLEMSEEQAFVELHEEAGDEAANVIPEQEPVAAELAEEGTNRINVLIEDELQARITQDEEFRTELSDTNKELVHSSQDGTSADLVEATSGMENQTQLVSKEPPVDTNLGLPEEQTSAMLEEETQEDYKVEETPVVVGLVEAMDGGLEVASEDELEEAGITHDAEESRAKLIDTIKELVDSTQDKIGAKLVETTGGKQQVVMAIKSKEIVSLRRKLKWRRWKIGFRKGTRRIREAMSKRMNQTRRMRTLCPSNRQTH